MWYLPNQEFAPASLLLHFQDKIHCFLLLKDESNYKKTLQITNFCSSKNCKFIIKNIEEKDLEEIPDLGDTTCFKRF